MLVLSRKKCQSVKIQVPQSLPPLTEIVVTVVEVRGDSVRLGFEAPCQIPIHRAEVLEAIERQNQLNNEDIKACE